MKLLQSHVVPFSMFEKHPKIEYRVTDTSVLYPILKKYLWQPALQWIPEWLSANTLTIVSNLGSIMAFSVAIYMSATQTYSPLLLLLSGLGLFFYMSLDNMDGSQARRTKTASPLGEFLDHWFDSFNLVLVMTAIFVTVQVPHALTLIMVITGCIAFLSQFWEQRLTGLLVFGRFGTVEAQVIAIFFYIAMAFIGIDWAITPLGEGLPTIGTLTAIAVVLGGVVTPIAIISRVRKKLFLLIPLTLLLVICGLWYFIAPVPFFSVCAITLLINGYISGRMIISRITDGDYYGVDLLLYSLLIVPVVGTLFAWGTEMHLLWSLIVIGYLAIRLIIDFMSTVLLLQGYLKERELLKLAVFAMTLLGFNRLGSKSGAININIKS